jgi:glycosyltransferase involved in cell wall biosynthesis
MLPARLLRRAVLEYLEYDARLFRWAVAAGGAAAAGLLWRLRRDKSLPFRILSRVHRAGGSALATRSVERLLARATRLERGGQATGLWNFYDSHVRSSFSRPEARNLLEDPRVLLGYRVLVLKSPAERERGVIAIDYSYIFPLFAAMYDLEAIGQRYYIVLEPSWRGLCTADILSYSRYDFPVFIEAVEPRDIRFIQSLGANFTTVPVAAHWWVDHRVLTPEPPVSRDVDVIMVAAWSAVKRHWRFFRVLADLRARGHKLKVVLAGYPLDMTRSEIENEARQFGVLDQLEIHEGVPLPEVARLLARSKIHVLWSRKEGANRATIEALFADAAIVLREGLSYGYHYPYVNPSTGHFATEDNLGRTLIDMLQRTRDYQPREWVMHNMTCQRATVILEEAIRHQALVSGERWTSGLAVKTAQLDTQRYWDPGDRDRFKADYAYLEGQLRRTP